MRKEIIKKERGRLRVGNRTGKRDKEKVMENEFVYIRVHRHACAWVSLGGWHMTILEKGFERYCSLGSVYFLECSVCIFPSACPQSSLE